MGRGKLKGIVGGHPSVRQREKLARQLADMWTTEAFGQASQRHTAEELVVALRREVLVLLIVALIELGALVLLYAS